MASFRPTGAHSFLLSAVLSSLLALAAFRALALAGRPWLAVVVVAAVVDVGAYFALEHATRRLLRVPTRLHEDYLEERTPALLRAFLAMLAGLLLAAYGARPSLLGLPAAGPLVTAGAFLLGVALLVLGAVRFGRAYGAWARHAREEFTAEELA